MKKVNLDNYSQCDTMSIDGGIEMYMVIEDFNNNVIRRFNNKPSPQGRKIVFLNKGGYELQREFANEFFEEGQILTIKEIEVGSWSSEVYVEECERNMGFNTVMFADLKEE